MEKPKIKKPTKEEIEIFSALQDIVVANLCAALDDDRNFIGEDDERNCEYDYGH